MVEAGCRAEAIRGVVARIVLGAIAVAVAGCMVRSAASADENAARPASQTVRLVIDYGDGAEKHITQIPWKAGLTAFDVLQFAKNHPHGISFRSTGSGATLLVTAIDGSANQGGGSEDRNWIFSINGKKGVKSCAVTELKASDVVAWKFDNVKL